MTNRTFGAFDKSPRNTNSSKKVQKSSNQWHSTLKVTQEFRLKNLKVGKINLTRDHSAQKYNSARKPDLMNTTVLGKIKRIDISSL